MDDSRHAPFPPTRASLVGLLGAPGTPAWRATWERFFRDYWRPLYAWLRRTGTGAPDALDLLQDFFAAGLDGAIFSDYDPARGRLRTYLLACLSNHRRKAWRRASARPGGSTTAYQIRIGMTTYLNRSLPGTVMRALDPASLKLHTTSSLWPLLRTSSR